MELWKPIIGFESFYEVSNTGKVRSFDNYRNSPICGGKRLVKGRILKYNYNNQGYCLVQLSNNKTKKKPFQVHRLVATAFCDNPHGYPIVNHKDCNPKNNNFINLEWCTYKYNSMHASINGRLSTSHIGKGEKCPAHKLKLKEVVEIKKRLKNKERPVDICKNYNICVSTIGEIKAGRSWGHVVV